MSLIKRIKNEYIEVRLAQIGLMLIIGIFIWACTYVIFGSIDFSPTTADEDEEIDIETIQKSNALTPSRQNYGIMEPSNINESTEDK